MGVLTSIEGSNPSFSACKSGGVAERSNAAVSKTVSGGYVRRGFKSLPLRSTTPEPATEAGFVVDGDDPGDASRSFPQDPSSPLCRGTTSRALAEPGRRRL